MSPDPARQTVDGFDTMSAGQAMPGIPTQRSSGSQMSPEPGRHNRLNLLEASSAGQVAVGTPVHNSSSSQISPVVLRRQMTPTFPGASSAGQPSPGVPVQVSFRSHESPDPGRQ